METIQGHKELLLREMEEIKGEEYAVRNPVTAAMDEYAKSLYLKVLCSVVQYGNTPSEMQILYLKRILKGMDSGDTQEECLRKALEMEGSDIREFVNVMKDKEARYYFALEGLLLAGLGERSRDNYEYLGELMGILGLSGRELEYLCQVAKSVLLQQTAVFDSARSLTCGGVEALDFLPYVREYYCGAVVNLNGRKQYYAPDQETSKGMILPNEYRNCDVSFENLAIDMTKAHWLFTRCGEVRFRNCRIEGGNYVIRMSHIKRVVVENCVFRHFTDRVLEMEQGEELEIVGSEFLSCGCILKWLHDYDIGGGVLYCDNSKGANDYVPLRSVLLKDNKFWKCYVASGKCEYVQKMGIIMSYHSGLTTEKIEKMTLIRNEFLECGWHNIRPKAYCTEYGMICNLYAKEEILEGNTGRKNLKDIKELTAGEIRELRVEELGT